MTQEGILFLEVVQATLDRNTDSWGKMDPYCVIAAQGEEFRTKTHSKGHQTPSWNEKFPIKITDVKGDIKITVLEEDTMSSDLVGDTTFRVTDLLGKDIDKWFDIYFEKKKAGSVYIRSKYVAANQSILSPSPKVQATKEESKITSNS